MDEDDGWSIFSTVTLVWWLMEIICDVDAVAELCFAVCASVEVRRTMAAGLL